MLLRFTRYYWGFLASVNLAGFMADQQPGPETRNSTQRAAIVGFHTERFPRYGVDRSKRLSFFLNVV